MKRQIIFVLALAATTARPATLDWTNTLGGDWFLAQNWTPNIVPGATDTANITQPGTYAVTIATGAVTLVTLNLGGPSGVQTLIQGSNAGVLSVNNGMVANNGVLVVTNGGIQGSVTIQPGGQLQFGGSAGLFLYDLTLTNLGSVTWSGGFLGVGGSGSANTIISNGGLWQVTGDYQISSGGGSPSIWINSGILRKTGGSGTATIGGVNFLNQPGSLVDAQSGTIQFNCLNSVFAGTMNAVSSARISFYGGAWTDAGGTVTGTGVVQFSGGTFNLRTNPIPGLPLVGGDIYIVGNSFQQGGAITNLEIDGATLHGTNTIGAGALLVNSGSIQDVLTVQPAGQLLLATANSKLLYNLIMTNLGTVSWNGGTLGFGGDNAQTTFIFNGGVWQMASDDAINYGGGSTPTWVNAGTLRKNGTTGISTINGVNFLNQNAGLVQSDSGTLQLPFGTTNAAGTLRLNGGKIDAFGTLEVTGGTLDGSGSLGSTDLAGGIVSPGVGGAGLIGFSTSLNLGAGATLSIDGSGLAPGTQYDQLSVTGAVALSNCTLQVTALPTVPDGTTFTIIANRGGAPVSGTFNGLAENALLNVGAQSFRIHYAGGSGHDVTLVRSSAVGPQLMGGQFNAGGFTLVGAGGASVTYTIQATTDFLQWTNIGLAPADLSGGFTFNDTNASLFQYRFYRAAQ